MLEFLPLVSFIMPTLNAEKYLGRSLASIRNQDYPTEKVEIIVADGGSTDNTIAIAQRYGCRVIPNPKVIHDAGVSLALEESNGEIRFIVAADNELPRRDWVSLMIKPFQENEDIYGAFPRVISPKEDDSVNRYFNLTHCDPFNWFVFHNEADPRLFDRTYPVIKRGNGYVIYAYSVERYPMIGFSQGFAVRKDFIRKPEYAADDILPVIQMIEEGKKIAHVPEACIYHWHLHGFKSFLQKYKQRVNDNLTKEGYGYRGRVNFLSQRRKRRQYLWALYSLTVVLPLFDALKGMRHDRDYAWLWHPLATFCLAWSVILEIIKQGLFSR